MADGTSLPIAAVKVGDEVLGENGQINRVVEIETPVLGTRRLYAFNDGPAFVTPEHPFLTHAGWKSIAPEATFAENNKLSVDALKWGMNSSSWRRSGHGSSQWRYHLAALNRPDPLRFWLQQNSHRSKR
jgi:hypothetical protein